MRSDARFNRERILEAAAEALAAPGDVSLKAIARRAGVGQGTLYRHFPSRESLVFEVYGEELAELTAAAYELLRTRSPSSALREWLHRLVQLTGITPDLAEAMRSASAPAELDRRPYGPLLAALAALVSANEAAHSIAPGTTPDDVLLLLGSLWQRGVGGRQHTRSERIFETIMRGLVPAAAAGDAPVGTEDDVRIAGE
ncbi:TetR/AcrR family transcriptional regulator [Streptomyces sp. WSLK1-3]|uniref:TetR/AcrR family transcriptional regulator n=1 Tax=Streptomyces sp. WSLK1-3 TaxID=3375475 RepID=UPI0037AD875D